MQFPPVIDFRYVDSLIFHIVGGSYSSAVGILSHGAVTLNVASKRFFLRKLRSHNHIEFR